MVLKMKKVYSGKISFRTSNDALPGELASEVTERCYFCRKKIVINETNLSLIKKLSGPDRTFCSFCLNHDFHCKKSKHILTLSFRSIIASFYYHNYMCPNRKMWLSQIQEYIDIHRQAGLSNPLFSYDPETYLWFVDFSKAGPGRKSLPIEEVQKTIINILTCFNLNHFFGLNSQQEVYKKYKEAIDLFYQKRFRPRNRRMLIPTFPTTLKLSPDKFRNFSSHHLKK